MKKISLMATALMALVGFTGCDNNADLYGDDLQGGKNGQLSLQLVNDARVNETSRANEAEDGGDKTGVFNPAEVAVANYTLTATDKTTNAEAFSGTMTELGANGGTLTRTIAEGTYTLAAENYDGSAVTVSERPWFRGETTCSILPGKTTEATVTCKLQNLQVKVALGQDFRNDFQDDYTITVDNGDGVIQTFTKDNVSKVYFFQVPENKDAITVSVKATPKETPGTVISRTYTVQKPEDAEGNRTLKAGDAFTLNIKTDGSMLSYVDFSMTVNFTFADQEFTFEIDDSKIVFNPDQSGGEDPDPVDPEQPDENPGNMEIEGLPMTYTNPKGDVLGDNDEVIEEGDKIVVNFKNVPNGIEHLYVTITSDNSGFTGILGTMGLAGTFDMADPGDLKDLFENNLHLLTPGENVKGATSFKFDVSGFIEPLRMFENGNNTFHIKVVDTQGNSVEDDLKINISDM